LNYTRRGSVTCASTIASTNGTGPLRQRVCHFGGGILSWEARGSLILGEMGRSRRLAGMGGS